MAVQRVGGMTPCCIPWLPGPVGEVGSVRQGLKESRGGMSKETRRGQGERGRILFIIH
jgi:hypothetical protein